VIDSTEPEPGVPVADVVLPCLDEAGALPWVLGRIPAGWRAIVVDNGSTDGSAEIAHALGARVVTEPRRGFGAACHAGLLAAEADYVCFCDCDASLDPALLPEFVRAVAAGETDLLLGRRRPRGRNAWPLHARVGNRAISILLRRRTGLRLRDLGPMRAARREALLGLRLTDRRSGYPLQMAVRAADAGWRVTERDVPYYPRTGKSKVTGTWRGTWLAIRDMKTVLAEPGEATVDMPAKGSTAPAEAAGGRLGSGDATVGAGTAHADRAGEER
jgi:glycosyltransferase involved in cell wall biosynthesis